MSDIVLCGEKIISARSFNHKDADGTHFDVRILSNAVVDCSISSILKGEVQLDSDPCVPGAQSKLEVAVKVVRHTRDRETARERLQRELQAVQRARHRFIVPFFGAADLGNLLLIVSPFMENGNLLQYLRTHPSANKQLLLLQVADAVCYLHQDVRMVHGDLKCENVLVSPEGNALLTDFGLSTLIDKPASDCTTGISIRRLCTLRFAAPELLLDEAKSSAGRVRSKTTATDVYAFGRLIIQVFTGEAPWPDDTEMHVILRVLYSQSKRVPHRPVAKLRKSGLNNQWWELCRSCLNYDPSGRPSMDRVRDRIAKAMAVKNARFSAADIIERYTVKSVAPMRFPTSRPIVASESDEAASGVIVLRIKLATASSIFFLFIRCSDSATSRWPTDTVPPRGGRPI